MTLFACGSRQKSTFSRRLIGAHVYPPEPYPGPILGDDANDDDNALGVCCARVESVALPEWPDSREKWKTLVKRASKNEINNYTTQDKRIR